ncbi:hypothetical protein [Stenotrophomonas sp. JAI102]|uniref:hypothetical protein n=1 Tax=Stenotrophomonas sp. JAI102 TaxID=2723077 RepID=UPI0015CC216F|nr:hypothetical protein [Stenotrophomonas sp. JAI102]NYF34929.1 hypothetical protein [Stenotrophomonas sp. JAI102]
MPAWLLALIMSATPVEPPTRQVHTCLVDGARHYQSTPCQGLTERIREMPPPADTWANDIHIESLRQELQARRRAGAAPTRQKRPKRPRAPPASGVRGALITVHTDPVKCAAARRQRETAYKKAGQRPSLALSRQMDDRVHDACR